MVKLNFKCPVLIKATLILSVLGVWVQSSFFQGDLLQSSFAQTIEPQRPKVALKERAHVPVATFAGMMDSNTQRSQSSLAQVIAGWQPSYTPMFLEMFGFKPNNYTESLALVHLMKATGLQTRDLNAIYEWVWAQDLPLHPDYAEFKAQLHETIDPRFREYFEKRPKTSIRLDEIRWGGVRRDGIPPLKNPAMISAQAATYLADSDIVFGVALPNPVAPGRSAKTDGSAKTTASITATSDVRAYPKRILAWHEMFKDRIAGREINGVYCTLCGAMILYDTTVNGVQHELGTSGFLYRSNKLMYDHATKSLWSTFDGTPVVGPLVGKGIVLPSLYVVTTTWGEWRKRHPNTTVLSPQTGHDRDYSEGAAYRNYFASDRLMFGVPKLDSRLPNKAEVLALRASEASAQPLAIAADFLLKNPVHHDRHGARNVVVLTDTSGANRAYDSGSVRMVQYDRSGSARDASGGVWQLEEDRLIGPGGQTMPRLAAHRAFWFGWYSAYPQTRLVH
jgi:Protein of unknown function (DUF3179)